MNHNEKDDFFNAATNAHRNYPKDPAPSTNTPNNQQVPVLWEIGFFFEKGLLKSIVLFLFL